MTLENAQASQSDVIRPDADTKPAVSIIIPARNEEANLDRLLRSLVVQAGVRFEVIIVDDGSTDRTGTIADSYTRVQNCPFLGVNQDLVDIRVLQARSPLPEGWTGKSNACWTGASEARGEWLLFTDADTEHEVASLSRALFEAKENRVGMLSFSPQQELRGLAQMAVMPVVFSELARVYAPHLVNDPKSELAAANGQYILIRRDVYDSVGGHSAVHASLLEDVQLARLVKKSGAGLRFRLGSGMVRARMYRGWADMRDGWTKNLALLFPNTRALAVARLMEFAAGAIGILGFLLFAMNAAWLPAAASGIVGFILLLIVLFRVREAHFGLLPSLLAPAGSPIFAWLLLRSAAAHASGKVQWKGRCYTPNATSSGSGESNKQ